MHYFRGQESTDPVVGPQELHRGSSFWVAFEKMILMTLCVKPFRTRAYSAIDIRVRNQKLLFISTKAYVVGTQKNRLDETVLLSTQNIGLN